ncbi:MAG: hypothetical protein UIG59_02020 [Acutalibacteraceae bacterium]|nr:hypothetical protein [Acutalibacteraceae bacterium]
MKCRIAELNIDFINRGKYLERISKDYAADFSCPDVTLTASDSDIAEEKKQSPFPIKSSMAEVTAMCRKLGHTLPKFNSFLLHAATFSLKGRGIAFVAVSGTGKSTHMLSWKNLFGDELCIINGDKPIIRIEGEKPVIYGTPWCGKEGLGANISHPLTDLCFIVRSDENKVVKLENNFDVTRLLGHVVVPPGSENIIKLLDLITLATENCNLWEIHCDASLAAAQVSSQIILEEK